MIKELKKGIRYLKEEKCRRIEWYNVIRVHECMNALNP